MFSFKILWSVSLSSAFYYSYLDFIIHSVLTLVPLLIIIAFFTLAERKAMASIQRRKGPSVVGIFGFLQPFADGLKLVVKEIIIPTKANKFLFVFGSFITLFLSFIGWISIPFDSSTWVFDLNCSLLYILVVSSLGVYGILLSGWASNSKYALMGCLRSVSQMISYEVSISLIVLPVILLSHSLSVKDIIEIQKEIVWFIFPLFPLGIIFFISILAETNRAPFDLPEAEAELVAGYNVEYSAFLFAAFFLGEYANILLMSCLFVIFFFGGNSSLLFLDIDCWYSLSSFFNAMWDIIIFSIKIILVTFLFIFVRANLPRFRFDQLMSIGWKIFLPLTLGFVFFFSGILASLNSTDISQVTEISFKNNFIDVFSIRF
jgi:NADH-quinone oxidoreductase subunit H